MCLAVKKSRQLSRQHVSPSRSKRQDKSFELVYRGFEVDLGISPSGKNGLILNLLLSITECCCPCLKGTHGE